MDYNLEYLSQEKERGIIRDTRGPSGERKGHGGRATAVRTREVF